jgi:hypothetical protein
LIPQSDEQRAVGFIPLSDSSRIHAVQDKTPIPAKEENDPSRIHATPQKKSLLYSTDFDAESEQKSSESDAESSRIHAGQDKQPIHGKPEKFAGVVPESSPIVAVHEEEPTKDEIIRYVKAGFASIRPSGYWQSRRTLADKLGFSQAKVDSIHNFLKDRGCVSVRGMKTFPNLTESEMVTRLRLHKP